MVTENDIKQFSELSNKIFEQISRDVIGQKAVVEGTVIAMIAGGKRERRCKNIGCCYGRVEKHFKYAYSVGYGHRR